MVVLFYSLFPPNGGLAAWPLGWIDCTASFRLMVVWLYGVLLAELVPNNGDAKKCDLASG